MLLPRDYNDELELAFTAANIKKMFDKRKRYFSFNQSSNHSIDDSSQHNENDQKENYKQNGKTPSFAQGYQMKSYKCKQILGFPLFFSESRPDQEPT